MRVLAFLLLLSTALHAQSVTSINFNYWYNTQGEVKMELSPVKQNDSITVFYSLQTTNPSVTSYSIKWEKRDSYNQKLGEVLLPNDSVRVNKSMGSGKLRFSRPAKPWLLVAEVTNKQSNKSWVFFCQIESHYPVNGYLEKQGEKQLRPYVMAGDRYLVRGSGSGKRIHFSYYKENFPTPSPPFAEKEFKMDRFLFPDSTFTAEPGQAIGPFKKEGLYLAQEDTLSSDGFAYLVMNDPYPRYNTLGDLKGPLLFVTTREENDLIGAAGEDKAKFDRVILNITEDRERAKTFMRNYFKRVEYANFTFTSFKEGWKTDRGMIIIVFGSPDEVFVDGQQEVWNYKSPRQRFTFTKAGSVYHPDHYVLRRDKDYTQNWYLTIDLWRKSRF